MSAVIPESPAETRAHETFPAFDTLIGRLVEQPAFSARLRRRGQVVTVREGPVRLGRHERREAMVGGRFVCVAGTGGCPIRALSRPICVRRTCRNRLAIVVVTGRSAPGLRSSRRVPGLLPGLNRWRIPQANELGWETASS